MTDKVLLTGISGFVAKHVAIELLNSGYDVLGTVRNINSIEQTKKTLEDNNVSTKNLSLELRETRFQKVHMDNLVEVEIRTSFPILVDNQKNIRKRFVKKLRANSRSIKSGRLMPPPNPTEMRFTSGYFTPKKSDQNR